MRETYQHTYNDGAKVTLIVATTEDGLLFSATPSIVDPKHNAEYEVWRNEVVCPDLFDKLPDEYREALILRGLKTLSEDQS